MGEAAKRIFKEKREHEQYKDVNESLEKIKTRISSEDKRYSGYYKVDYHNRDNYDIIIDTTKIKPEEVVEGIIGIIKGNFT